MDATPNARHSRCLKASPRARQRRKSIRSPRRPQSREHPLVPNENCPSSHPSSSSPADLQKSSQELPTNPKMGLLRIADFGLGRFHRYESLLSKGSRVGGTEAYMPPEIPPKKCTSPKGDIWSLACLYLEFLSWAVLGSARMGLGSLLHSEGEGTLL